MREVLETYDVDTVYHAAAYKHVPLVEHNMIEGVHNNVFGTLHTAEAAIAAGVKSFVLVSTDKAVLPTNVMGATKRFAELVLQGLNQRGSSTTFSMVRFGNVLASSGSVVPLFREQIRNGGPVTVTHPEIYRYFMTIPEAASLVLQAGSMGTGGDVFVLDMGKPVRIRDLAEKMIHLMGLTVRDETHPDGDIEIRYTGLRPAEKLYEELLIGNNVIRHRASQHHARRRGLPSVGRAQAAAGSDLDRVPEARLHEGARGAAARRRRLFAHQGGRGSRLAPAQRGSASRRWAARSRRSSRGALRAAHGARPHDAGGACSRRSAAHAHSTPRLAQWPSAVPAVDAHQPVRWRHGIECHPFGHRRRDRWTTVGEPKPLKILVTGGAGFIGSAVIRCLLAAAVGECRERRQSHLRGQSRLARQRRGIERATRSSRSISAIEPR